MTIKEHNEKYRKYKTEWQAKARKEGRDRVYKELKDFAIYKKTKGLSYVKRWG